MRLIMILINDELQADMYKKDIEPNLEEGNMLCLLMALISISDASNRQKNVDVTMIAPKAPGHTVRSEYQAGKGTPCLIAVEQDYRKSSGSCTGIWSWNRRSKSRSS